MLQGPAPASDSGHDKTRINGIIAYGRNASMVTALITVTHSLQMRTVAESFESVEQPTCCARTAAMRYTPITSTGRCPLSPATR